MKIILLGYGKMGKIIERIALERGHEISAKIDLNNAHEFATAQGDVAIEFSHPDAAFNNLVNCINKNIPVVCGTTGWLHRKHELESLCKEKNGAFFYASNYSLGVNIFFKLNEYLAKMMSNLKDYDVSMDEIHHTEKKDAPSGTAITLAEGVLKHSSQKTKWVNESSSKAEDLEIKSFRIAEVPGTHSVKYASAIDDLEIRHIAHSREGFAKGAVMVAEWLKDKKGIFGMDDYLKF
ncbi:4-hydroxy-tetrahydrodipicolinate reductase [Pseudochryseolinea flava]|uniref:4-hydroxy-tetrahydrodipicolinate reductase n=1 Tax=Pseudochryseolinea flava TaxID=2059302 RepID=A0A364XZ61_9BACT|nr:4-hydroxy-tetrahydrodipicolinate reductase [Pseudochryseolinea flava]RAV99585.1 4-hydroxy-tetrahydrodipicolinate reductase [Pseudochryseolinea flava]